MTSITFIYGGAFDPITIGHESIIYNLSLYIDSIIEKDKFDSVHRIIAVTANDEKSYHLSLKHRMEMVQVAIPEALGWKVVEQETRMAAFVRNLRKEQQTTEDSIPGPLFVIALGYDEWEDLKHNKWVESDFLLHNCSFIVVDRPDVHSKYTRQDETGYSVTHVKWGVPCVSSTQVRNDMRNTPLYAGKDVSIPVSMYLRGHHLLGQTTAVEYEEIENKGIDSYNPKDFPKPSVTATTLITFQDCVLLVRRKNFPDHDMWCFPGGFANPHENIETVGAREVLEETQISIPENKIIQLGVFTPNDPRIWKFEKFWSYDVALWADVSLHQNTNLLEPMAADDAKDARWFPIKEVRNMQLAFHHNKILEKFLSTHPGYV